MTRYQDLSPCRYSDDALDADAWKVPLLTIGWLESPFPYDRGRKPSGFLPRLEALAHGAQWHRCGYHFLEYYTCSLCVATLREPPAFEAALTEANAGVLPPLLADPRPAAAGDGVSCVDSILDTTAIAHYLEHHPDAADTVEGIANGWLAGEYARTAVEQALTALVQSGLLQARIEPDGTAVYSSARRAPPR